MSNVRVRVAPSPTGAPHVGTAYIALFNLAFARRHGGQLVLRIEDTDQARSLPAHEERLVRALRWLGLDWDEGPDVGGDCGPYRQSERLGIYRQHADELLEKGHAYYSFASADELASWRAEGQAAGVPAPFEVERNADPAAGRQRAASGEAHVVRMKMPREGSCIITDMLRSEPITIDYARLDDQVLLKSDGFPTYHLAVVVDDHLMGISHIIRGEEWINSTPKHLLMYQWFGWDPPEHAHLPLLLNPDGSKMSKRRNPTSIDYYRRAGYLSEALLNYLALMAYPPAPGAADTDEEKEPFDGLVERFDLARVNLGGSIFDVEKLNWLNGRYLREDLTPEQLLAALRDWAFNDDFLAQVIPLMQPRMETLGDLMPKCSFFFSRRVEPALEDLLPKGREAADVAALLQTAVWSLESVHTWQLDAIEAAVKRISEFWDWPVRDVTRPLYTAIMGQPVGPPLYESIVLLDVDLTRTRLLEAIEVLGGISRKKAKKLEKDWSAG
ncbi:MAG: glutamate--tRNA ligase [Gemmatimonadetes bacterium]|jgi:glutamyl-tRNA synthetase|nr:glutamate--tRNA ligase [Gemmatimonadota bacterium]